MFSQITESGNSELPHAELKGRTVQAQPYCCALWPRQDPLGLLQSRKNLSSFNLFKSLAFSAGVTGYRTVAKVLERDSQDRTRGQNHRPLGHILQLTDVARPAIADEAFHSFRGDRINRPAHLPRKVLNEVTNKQRDVFQTLA